MDAQNLRIEELLQKIKQQQYKLDKQNLQIKSLQSKVSSRPALWLGHHSLVLCAALVTGEHTVPLLLDFGNTPKAVALVLVPLCWCKRSKLPECLHRAIGGIGVWEQSLSGLFL